MTTSYLCCCIGDSLYSVGSKVKITSVPNAITTVEATYEHGLEPESRRIPTGVVVDDHAHPVRTVQHG